MSQTFCERCGFPVPMRWLHAGGDLARPNHIHQCVDRPLMRSKRPPKCFTTNVFHDERPGYFPCDIDYPL